MVKTHAKTNKVGHVILCSSNLALEWEKLVDYYSLRFQIEFNFRDAKQHFGLEDFMNTTAVGVENAANLAFLLVNVSAKLLQNSEETCVGMLDLKTRFRGVKYALETIKILLEKPETILMPEAIEEVKARISQLGSIHQTKAAAPLQNRRLAKRRNWNWPEIAASDNFHAVSLSLKTTIITSPPQSL